MNSALLVLSLSVGALLAGCTRTAPIPATEAALPTPMASVGSAGAVLNAPAVAAPPTPAPRKPEMPPDVRGYLNEVAVDMQALTAGLAGLSSAASEISAEPDLILNHDWQFRATTACEDIIAPSKRTNETPVPPECADFGAKVKTFGAMATYSASLYITGVKNLDGGTINAATASLSSAVALQKEVNSNAQAVAGKYAP